MASLGHVAGARPRRTTIASCAEAGGVAPSACRPGAARAARPPEWARPGPAPRTPSPPTSPPRSRGAPESRSRPSRRRCRCR
eukprot:6673794-Heterocapsa_arctica.AAC.1